VVNFDGWVIEREQTQRSKMDKSAFDIRVDGDGAVN